MPVIMAIRMGAKKQHINVARKASSVTSRWYLISDRMSMIVNIPNIISCICQQLCNCGIVEIAAQ